MAKICENHMIQKKIKNIVKFVLIFLNSQLMKFVNICINILAQL